MKPYQTIINKLVKKSFPELRGRKIKFFKIPSAFPLGIGTVVRGKKRDYIIYSGQKIKQKNEKELQGFFVHELCHLSDLQKFSPSKSFMKYNLLNDLALSLLFPLFYPLERSADITAIKKGYGKFLYANCKKVSSKFPKSISSFFFRRGYLSPEQIKSYAKKIKKW